MTNSKFNEYDGNMEGKIALATLSFFLIFAAATSVYAQDSTTTRSALPKKLKPLIETKMPIMHDIEDKKMKFMEEMNKKREEFKMRLQTIRDENKKLIIDRIDINISSMNKKAGFRLSTVLEKLQSILNRIVAKAAALKTKGVDTTAVDSAVASAQKAINDAKIAVANQIEKIYVIQIASESALRSDVGSTISLLRGNLRDTYKAVLDAKLAVQKTVMEVGLLSKFRNPIISISPTATGSSQ